MLNDYAYTVNSSWEDRVSFPFEKQEPSTQPGTEKVLEKYLLNQREWVDDDWFDHQLYLSGLQLLESF